MGKGKVRIAFLGCGGMMGAHARRLKDHPDVDIVGLCDVSLEVTRRFAETQLAGSDQKPQQFSEPGEKRGLIAGLRFLQDA